MKRKYSLEELLVREGLITEEQLDEAQIYKNEKRMQLSEALIELNMCSEEIIVNMISKQLQVPIKRIKDIEVDPTVVDLIPERIVKEHQCFAFGRGDETLQILVRDPLNLFLEDEIFRETGLRCEFYLVYENELQEIYSKYYEDEKTVKELEILEQDDDGAEFFDVSLKDENSPIIKIVNSIFKQAVIEGASDIHIGITETKVDVRFRIDGILHRVRELPKKAHPAMVSRIKTMADMDITDKRQAQDGRIQINVDGKNVDMRVSTLPTVHGEKLTTRLLDKENMLLEMKQLGFHEDIEAKFSNMITAPVGIILITGPTGSGKSTTLYTVINELNDVSKNIITIEDPVEYRLDGIVQVQVNPKAGLTFASGLRSILRQDPNIILVGEIRDNETASIAVKASNTGHLVFATLHTNDSVSSILRLADMGVERYLVASTVMGVVNQRLIRRICENCKESYVSKGFDTIRAFFRIPEDKELTLYRGKGCEHCKYTGYKGRIAIHELLEMTDEIRSLMIDGAHKIDIERKAIENGMKTLKEDGYEKALRGLTTLEEVKRFVVD